jgi:hypothetical protein
MDDSGNMVSFSLLRTAAGKPVVCDFVRNPFTRGKDFPRRVRPSAGGFHDNFTFGSKGVDDHHENLYPEIEARLRPLAAPLEGPEAGDWLAEHPEPGQTFEQYLAASPVRRGRDLTTINTCLLGDFTERRRRVTGLTQEYLGFFFDVPVVVRCRIPLPDIPARARRTHPDWGDDQILSTYVLREVLEPDRPTTPSPTWP